MSVGGKHQRTGSAGFTVVISLSLVLFMLGTLGLVLINAAKLSVHFRQNLGFQIFLKDAANQAETDLLMQQLGQAPYTRNVTMVSKERAAEQLKDDLGEDFMVFLGHNPLLNSIEIKLNAPYAEGDSLELIEKSLMSKPIVKEVVYQKLLISRLNKNARTAAFFLLIFSAALLVVALTLMNNTIRLSIYSQRFLLRTMYLVGATAHFISKPFIVRGVKQGFTAGIISCIMLSGFIVVSARFIPELLQLQDENLLFLLFAGIILLGITISSFSAFMSVSRYLKLKTSDLYL
jgi:cell division transport system permease protein